MDTVGVRLQSLPLADQVLSLSRLVEGRSETGRFAPADIDALFDEVSLPRPAKVSNVMGTLEKKGS